MRNICRSIIFCLILALLFGQVQNVLSLDWKKQSDTAPIFAGFEALEKDSIDVLFIGNSLVEQGVSPMRIYEKNNIVGYNLALPAQDIDANYYILKNAFNTQKPKVVVLGVGCMFQGIVDAAWRYSIGILPIGKIKYDMAKEHSEKTDVDIVELLFPIIHYKYRWAQINRGDFQSEKPRPYYSAGFYPVTAVSSTSVTSDLVQATIADMRLRDNQEIKRWNGKEIETDSQKNSLYESVAIDEQKFDSIKKIKALCEDHGAELVMIKIPSIVLPQKSKAALWTKENAEAVKKVASELNIPFYDLMNDYDDIIDFTKDSTDGGSHLNFRGAEKVSDVLADLLAQYVHASAGESKVYDQMLDKYKKVRTIAMLQSTMDFPEYLQRLADNVCNWTIYISGSNEFTNYLTEQDVIFMAEKLHTKLIGEAKYQDSYLAVINKGEVLYEAFSNQRITEQMTVNQETVNLVSSGWLSKPLASIEINGTEYAVNGLGLNIVVYDNEFGIVIDSVSFDTFQESRPALRNWNVVNDFLRTYESKVGFEKN